VYVLEDSIVMGLNGGKEVTPGLGQTFYEGPDDVHTVGRNASSTKPSQVCRVLAERPAQAGTGAGALSFRQIPSITHAARLIKARASESTGYVCSTSSRNRNVRILVTHPLPALLEKMAERERASANL
jgi:hypothetical protein